MFMAPITILTKTIQFKELFQMALGLIDMLLNLVAKSIPLLVPMLV